MYVGPSTTTRIRHLTIATTSGAGAGVSLMLHDLTGPVHISDVTLHPRGAGAYGIFQLADANPDNRWVTGDRIVINTVGVSEALGVYLVNAAPTFTDLKVEASTVEGEGTQSVAVLTFGKDGSGFSPTIARADLTASAALAAPVIFADGSNILVRDSKLIAFGQIVTVEGGALPRLVNNEMQGSVPAGVTCLNNYTLGATPLNCPT